MAGKKHPANLLTNVFLGLAGLFIVLGITTGIIDWRSNDTSNKHASLSHAKPSSAKPTKKTLVDYVVAPTLPRYLIIPKLGVNAKVLAVGLNADGSLVAPYSIFDTAWYDQSAQPGQKGAMLIDGHISSWTSHGVFYGLDTLLPGDQIYIQGGNGSVFSYKVVATKVYDFSNVDMSAAMSSVNPDKPGLNLISCTGDVISGTNEFNKRIIVFATQG